MKIVDRKTFLAMPAGTVFCKFRPSLFGDICIKESTICDVDFFVQYLHDAVECSDSEEFFQRCDIAQRGVRVAMDFERGSRDGCYDKEQLFAVWDSKDVDALIARLQLAQRDAAGVPQ